MYDQNDHVKESEMGRARSTQGEEECLQDSGEAGRTGLEVGGRVILKCVLGWGGMDWIDLDQNGDQ
jgi:hypothetical protein